MKIFSIINSYVSWYWEWQLGIKYSERFKNQELMLIFFFLYKNFQIQKEKHDQIVYEVIPLHVTGIPKKIHASYSKYMNPLTSIFAYSWVEDTVFSVFTVSDTVQHMKN